MWFQCRFLLIVLALSLDPDKLLAYGKYHRNMCLGPLRVMHIMWDSGIFTRQCEIVSGGGPDKSIRVWDGLSGECVLGPLEGHTEETTVSFSSNSQHILSGSADKTIKVWDSSSGTCIIGPLEGHMESVTCVAFSPDDTRSYQDQGQDNSLDQAEESMSSTTKQM